MWGKEVRPEIPRSQIDQVTGLVLGVDLRDQSPSPFLRKLRETIQRHAALFFGHGVKYSDVLNVKQCVQTDSLCWNEVYSVVPDQATEVRGGEAHLMLSALIAKGARSGFLLRRYRVVLAVQPDLQPIRMKPLSEYFLRREKIEMKVSVRDLTLTLSHARSGYWQIMPLAAGGVNTLESSGMAQWMTQEIPMAELHKTDAYAFRKRCEPDYFKCLPFIPIRVAGADQRTDLGFHAFPGNEFKRGYLSHGCLRLRVRDLLEVYAIVMQSASSATGLKLLHSPYRREMHPYPVFVDHVMAVRNCGKGQSCRDSEGLTELIARPMSTVKSLFENKSAEKVADLGVPVPSFN